MHKQLKAYEMNMGEDRDEQQELLLKLKPKGVDLYMPEQSWLWATILDMRCYLMLDVLGLQVSYFVARHRVPLLSRRAMDLVFIIHGTLDHPDKRWWTALEGIRWMWFWKIKYGKEFMFYVDHQKTKKKRLKEFVELYTVIYFCEYWNTKDDDMLRIYHGPGSKATDELE